MLRIQDEARKKYRRSVSSASCELRAARAISKMSKIQNLSECEKNITNNNESTLKSKFFWLRFCLWLVLIIIVLPLIAIFNIPAQHGGLPRPASADRSLFYYQRYTGRQVLVFSKSDFENTTIYYGVCDGAIEQTQKTCTVYRVRASFSGDNDLKKDECNITLRSESGGFIRKDLVKIDPLGKHRAIVRWIEQTVRRNKPYHLRFSVVDFSDCTVKTTKLSEDLNQLVPTETNGLNENCVLYSLMGMGDRDFCGDDKRFDKLIYLKGEDDFEVVYHDFKLGKVYRSSIDAEVVASKVDTLLTYPEDIVVNLLIVPLSKDNGYLFIETSFYNLPIRYSMTVAHVQSNGQRQNLTYVEDVYLPLVSLANGMIGICAEFNLEMMKCTQFELGDKQINWFLANIVDFISEHEPALYNLPRGEGFLTDTMKDQFGSEATWVLYEYMVKIGPDGEVKQFLNPVVSCDRKRDEVGFFKFFEDDRGNYCVSTTCVREPEDWSSLASGYIKLHSKCFKPEDLKNFIPTLV